MTTLLKPFIVREELLKRHLKVFSPIEFNRTFQVSGSITKYFLEKQVGEGLFIRLKKGLYALKTDIPSEEEIANVLYKPSYISLEYALAYHNILPEMPYQIISVTTKPTRIFTVEGKEYVYYTIKKTAYTGYSLVQSSTKSFIIADPEKSLVDLLYFVSLGKKPHNNRLRVKHLNQDKIYRYAQLFGRKSLVKLVKEIYDHSG